MRAIAVVAAAVGLLAGGKAAGESLDEMCRALDEAPATACALERAADWELRTALIVSEGSSDQVKRVEERFCELARRHGFAARVRRLNQLPDHVVGSAEMSWSCATPAVSAAPPR